MFQMHKNFGFESGLPPFKESMEVPAYFLPLWVLSGFAIQLLQTLSLPLERTKAFVGVAAGATQVQI